MTEIDNVMLIKSDADNNNNKFYNLRLYDDGTVKARYGRVGTGGQHRTYSGGQRKFDKIIAEKTKPENPKTKKGGYTRAKVIGASSASKVKGDLGSIARQQIKYSNCKDTEELIKKLVKWNVHSITSRTDMTVDVSSGQIQLPSGMGVLTQDAMDDARELLRKIDGLKSPKARKRNKACFTQIVNDYLRLVPQQVPSKRGWIDYIFADAEAIKHQEGLLDSLEGTLNAIDSGDKKVSEQVFDTELKRVHDDEVRHHIEKLYHDTRQKRHISSRLEVKGIYYVQLSEMARRFGQCKLDNIWELWHGTSAGNLLSILKSGLIIPRSASHGRLYGNGIYFSDQSTKALNYAAGFWSGNRESRCFMFLADVKMGKYYTPQGYGTRYYGRGGYPAKGHDSTFAKGGNSGVLNNEMIVYSLPQVNLKYLVEFG